MTDPLDLRTRDGLPDELLALYRLYPRETWEGDANLGPLTRFWLDRHLGFRDLLGGLQDRTRQFQDREIEPQQYAHWLSQAGSALIHHLHEHHHVEDAHYFPLLNGMEPGLARGFEILDRDHAALDGLLGGFAEATNSVLRSYQGHGISPDDAGGYARALDSLSGFLDRHLTDEEDLVVPVLLKHGEP